MRKTSRQLAGIIAAALAVDAGTPIAYNLLTVGTDKALKFTGSVDVDGTVYEFAADNGKVQNFSDVDGFVKKVSKFHEDGEGVYTVTIDTGAPAASAGGVAVVLNDMFSLFEKKPVKKAAKPKNTKVAKTLDEPLVLPGANADVDSESSFMQELFVPAEPQKKKKKKKSLLKKLNPFD
jgi:hypothetical protein